MGGRAADDLRPRERARRPFARVTTGRTRSSVSRLAHVVRHPVGAPGSEQFPKRFPVRSEPLTSKTWSSMRDYQTAELRNLAVVGHGTAGKTTLVSALLYAAGAVTRLARVEDGNTTTDFEEDEIERGISLSAASTHFDWNGVKVNLLDTPGVQQLPHRGEAGHAGRRHRAHFRLRRRWRGGQHRTGLELRRRKPRGRHVRGHPDGPRPRVLRTHPEFDSGDLRTHRDPGPVAHRERVRILRSRGPHHDEGDQRSRAGRKGERRRAMCPPNFRSRPRRRATNSWK